ncbi:MAG: acetaldehyde dehydrogenase (acetylating) [Candidatus Doudnabacteria bacterium CG10_big_fil_rev_8_21_14_0_10_42_18]|uniref:Acetaldehyde dehydrogenase n=1 Tax=Candidatus Doudnabacteria bacterium CG10_big_fil_rev_8_21_14_0_10_42_18 TaxID=1974552 RepID=A0A2H0V9X3_9BACT|nr:MAG: acetaldehyde dehydrogenase (acetylating) [Candidatus Doudnabacteria bacterium CG10_big_fil_rev_8_21_14_0_10_42_18]
MGNNNKMKAAIIGTGNIGTDLLFKVQRSEFLECSLFTGRRPESEGIARAKAMGVRVSVDSIKAIEAEPDICEIVFDTTSAKGHSVNAPILKKLGKFVIDLTPSRIGKMCVPAIDLNDSTDRQNLSMVTCGGQATVPIAKAIMEIHPETKYIEVIGSISSKSAGPGTRANIDEYTQTTKDAIELYSGVPKAKAIIILNPADPPVWMHNTLYASIENPKMEELKARICEIEKQIQEYVPGYHVVLGPIFENGRLTVMVQVEGAGDFLPKYSGNLDIITSAAVRVAEEYAKKKLVLL